VADAARLDIVLGAKVVSSRMKMSVVAQKQDLVRKFSEGLLNIE